MLRSMTRLLCGVRYFSRENIWKDLKWSEANRAPLTPISFLERAGSVYRDRVSIVYGSTRFTWAQTLDRCTRLASALASLHVKPGDVRLYELGGRRIMVTATGPLGCVPSQRALRTLAGECDPTLQRAATIFNAGVRNIINQLNAQYGSTVYTFANSFDMNMDFVNTPRAFGNSPLKP